MWLFNKGSGKDAKERPKELTLDEKADKAEDKIRKIDAQLTHLKKILSGPGSASAKEGVRNQAINLIRQRKLYQNHVNTLNQHSYNLDQVNLTRDSYKSVLSTYSSMKDSHKELKSLSRKLNSDRLDDLKDKMSDLVEKSEEFSAIISAVDDTYIDDEELNAELEVLNYEFEDSLLQDEPPEAKPTVVKNEDEVAENELSQLMSELERPKGEEQPNPVK